MKNISVPASGIKEVLKIYEAIGGGLGWGGRRRSRWERLVVVGTNG